MRFLREKFAQRLAAEMNRANLKQAHVAAKIGVTPTSVYRWLKADAFPEDDALIELSNIFGVTGEDWFFERREEPKPVEDAAYAGLVRENHTLKEEIASIKSDPAYELQRKLVQLKQKFGSILIKKDKKIKDLRAQLAAKNMSQIAEKNDTSSERVANSPNSNHIHDKEASGQYHKDDIKIPPEILRALDDPSMLDDVIELIRHLEAEKSHLEPASKRKS